MNRRDFLVTCGAVLAHPALGEPRARVGWDGVLWAQAPAAAPASELLRRNLLTFGLGGVLMPFPFIKGIDLALVAFGLA